MGRIYTFSKTGLTQADGVATINLGVADGCDKHIIQIIPSATPTAGTVQIDCKIPGASGYSYRATLDLSAQRYFYELSGFFESIKFTPDSFDADKTFAVFIASGK